MSDSVLPMFSSRSFIVSGVTFRPLIHFEFIFVYGVRKCSSLYHFASSYHQPSIQNLTQVQPQPIFAPCTDLSGAQTQLMFSKEEERVGWDSKAERGLTFQLDKDHFLQLLQSLQFRNIDLSKVDVGLK